MDGDAEEGVSELELGGRAAVFRQQGLGALDAPPNTVGLAEELFTRFGADPMYDLARALEAAAAERLGPKGIYPNVDFYSGLVYRKLGIPRDLFTPIFAIARTAGWLAHWREQLGANRIFRPSQIYTGSPERPWLPLEQRPLPT